MSVAQRFWTHVQRSDGCWEWIGARGPDGYGRMVINHRSYQAHRLCWTFDNGPIPEGLCVLHHCDNPPCVRPDHLWLGTRGENNRDRDAKGRGVAGWRTHPERFRGEGNSHARLRNEDVFLIRRLVADGTATQAELARDLGMSFRAIHSIVTYETWSFLP